MWYSDHHTNGRTNRKKHILNVILRPSHQWQNKQKETHSHCDTQTITPMAEQMEREIPTDKWHWDHYPNSRTNIKKQILNVILRPSHHHNVILKLSHQWQNREKQILNVIHRPSQQWKNKWKDRNSPGQMILKPSHQWGMNRKTQGPPELWYQDLTPKEEQTETNSHWPVILRPSADSSKASTGVWSGTTW